MSHASVFQRLALDPVGRVVVTPTRRLARAFARDFDAWQSGRGARLWETPRVLPYGAFVASLHDIAQHDPALQGVRAPLSSAQELALWEAVVAASEVALASAGAAAQLAAEAWSLAHQWQIADRLRHYALSEDTRVFAQWAADYERRVERLGATDQARLPDVVRGFVVAGTLAPSFGVVLVGFDALTPQQDALLDALSARGTEVERLGSERRPGACARLACGDARDELQRMADWVAARLAANPDARIGIVVPDLGARRRAVSRALDAALTPDALLAAPDRARPYTVSLGGSLADAPPIMAALRALRLAVGAIDFAEASALVRSRHVAFGTSSARACFELEWRRRAGRTIALDQLLAAARDPRNVDTAPQLALEALQAWRNSVASTRRRFSEWASLLMDGLRAVGFPGNEPPDSAEYQTLLRWQELLGEFAALERVEGPTELAGAVARLAKLAASTVFQPEGGDPPVQVLGLLEANGLAFDHLWITGMTSEGWPVPVRAHPLLPLELQRAKRMPGAVVEIELERARAALHRLASAADEVVASYAERDGDRMLSPAFMIADWPLAGYEPHAPRAIDAIGSTTLATLPDSSGPALPPARAVGGGVATLTDQSVCPFRAFARHRLGANEPQQPHDGLAASERGELVHRVLADFWKALPERTRSHVAAMSIEERERLLEQAAGRAIDRVRQRRLDGVGDALLRLEKRRLVRLTSDWIAFEIEARGDFEVKWTEERLPLAIGPLSLTGQIDRVDCLADGRTVVIDYKTGGPSSVKAWLGERPDEPQLPLYLVATQPDARGVSFARLRAGERRFVTLAEDAAMLPGARVDEWQRLHSSWPGLVEAWRRELLRLAENFVAGVATVAPKRADSCRYCDVSMLCRLNERAGERGEDDGDEGGVDE